MDPFIGLKDIIKHKGQLFLPVSRRHIYSLLPKLHRHHCCHIALDKLLESNAQAFYYHC